MERREQYDPEDIESLLQERSFDELLEEERAYVLRHLSGRDEYEKMRALLLHVREDDRRHQPIVADEMVRENVMQAFRAQQQPQWRVWLNTVGGLFQPSEGFSMWRPALALGMLLILFGIGFYLVRGPLAGTTNEELAEARRQKAEEPMPVKRTEATDSITSSHSSTREETPTDPTIEEISSGKAVPSAPAPTDHTPASIDPVKEEADQLYAVERVANEPTERVEGQVRSEKSVDNAAIVAPTSTSPHVVTEAEMMRNQSMANASGQVKPSVRAESKSKVTTTKKLLESNDDVATSRPVSQDPALLDLLSAGW